MRLVHVVPHIDQEAAGPSYSVPRLCQSLAACGNEVELTCLAARGDIAGVTLDLHPQWPVLERFAVSTSLARALARKAGVVDVVHNHSLWSMVNVASGWVVPGRRCQAGYVAAWHAVGLGLEPESRMSSACCGRCRNGCWRGRICCMRRAKWNWQEIRAQGFTAPVAVIPNGIDLPDMRARREATQ